MTHRAVQALNQGKSVVYDATNMTRKSRRSIISLCSRFVRVEAHVIWQPIEVCLERDAQRKRSVGNEVIDKMLKRFQAPYYDEGIDVVKVILPSTFDSLQYRIDATKAMAIPHDNPYHTLSVAAHVDKTLNCALNYKEATKEILTAAFWHDVGKPYTKSFINSRGETTDVAHFYNHESIGAWMSYGLVELPYIAWLISTHMEPFKNSKYYQNLPEYLRQAIDILHGCDLNAH